MRDLIKTIEDLCNESDENASAVLAKIKAAIRNDRKPDFSKIKDGEHFVYRDIEWIRLGFEQDGVLCMVAKPICEAPFDNDGCNNWVKSSARKMLNTEFLARLNADDLLRCAIDLTADNGDDSYGKCFVDKVVILSCDLYRKYRQSVPLFDKWVWTCTPWFCSDSASSVRSATVDGILNISSARSSYGLAPACIFKVS